MPSLHRHSSGRSPFWFASYLGEDGKFKLRSTKHTDRTKAMQVAIEYERAARMGRAGELTEIQCRKVLNDILERTSDESFKNISVEQYFDEWLQTKELAKSEGTMERYAATIKLFKKHIGEKSNRSLRAVTPADIQSFLNSRLKNGKVAPKTAQVDIKTLNTAFNRARRHGLIESNPVEAVELPTIRSSSRDTFTPEQVQSLVVAAHTSEWKTLILLGYYTGARLSDCASMEWGNVDMEQLIIAYEPQKTRNQNTGAAKVIVPIHPVLADHLKELRKGDGVAYLCPSLLDKGSGGKHGLSESFKRIMKKAGIDSQEIQGEGLKKFNRLTFHSLRHSFNSALANAGVTQEIRMKLTGHKTVAINEKYTHHQLELLRNSIEKIPTFNVNSSLTPAK